MTKSPPTPSHPDSTPSPENGFQLVLMRHAKSDWSGEDLSDHDRPLNKRGLRDAPKMARWIGESGLLPSLILCSSATRTQQTAALMQSYWENTKLEKATLHIIPELYLATAETILEIIGTDSEKGPAPRESSRSGTDRATPREGQTSLWSPRTVLVLAHNPGISYAASALLGQAIGLSTAAVVALRCDVPDWSTPLTADNTQCVAEMKPKSLDHDHRLKS